jgi:hypothetical protein
VLISVDDCQTRVWRVDVGGTLTEVVQGSALAASTHLVAFPAAGQVAALRDRRVAFLDARTLGAASRPPGMPRGPADGLWCSPRGELAAVSSSGRVGVADPWPAPAARLLTTPMADLHPGDLARAAELERTETRPEVRDALGLLRACLECRFGTEIAIGADRPAVSDTEISL